MTLKESLFAAFLLFAPALFHLGLLTAAPLRPRQRSREPILGRILFDYLIWIFGINGVLLAAAHILNVLGHQTAAIIILVAGLPTFVAQGVALIYSKAEFFKGRGG